MTFDGNDGLANQGSKQVTFDSPYGDLPTPVRKYTITFNGNGGTPSYNSKTVSYTFNGWFSKPVGGVQVKSTDIMQIDRDSELYAHWTAPTYGNLPTCSRSASGGYTYTFKGWYTAKSGGSVIEADNVVNLSKDQTLYAQWDSKLQTVPLTLTGGLDFMTKVRVYNTSSGYTDYTNYNSIPVYPGQVVELHHYDPSNRYWTNDDLNTKYGKGILYFTVPSTATSGSTLYIRYFVGSYNGMSYPSILCLNDSSGWVENISLQCK